MELSYVPRSGRVDETPALELALAAALLWTDHPISLPSDSASVLTDIYQDQQRKSKNERGCQFVHIEYVSTELLFEEPEPELKILTQRQHHPSYICYAFHPLKKGRVCS